MVEDVWEGLGSCDIMRKLKGCNKAVWQWGMRNFKGDDKKIKFCKDQMTRLRAVSGDHRGHEFSIFQRRYFDL